VIFSGRLTGLNARISLCSRFAYTTDYPRLRTIFHESD